MRGRRFWKGLVERGEEEGDEEERREGRENVFQSRERKKIRNGIFLVPLPNKYLFPRNYQIALALERV
jgi:hypothetical protein